MKIVKMKVENASINLSSSRDVCSMNIRDVIMSTDPLRDFLGTQFCIHYLAYLKTSLGCEVVDMIVEHENCKKCNGMCVINAARNGDLPQIEFLVSSGCYLDRFACLTAAYHDNVDCFDYLWKSGCPVNKWLYTGRKLTPECRKCVKKAIKSNRRGLRHGFICAVR